MTNFRDRLTPAVLASVLAMRAGAQPPQPNIVGPQWADAGAAVGTAGLGLLLDYARLTQPGLWRGRLTAHTNLGGGWNPDEPNRSV